jgi:hypothetical protein
MWVTLGLISITKKKKKKQPTAKPLLGSSQKESGTGGMV